MYGRNLNKEGKIKKWCLSNGLRNEKVSFIIRRTGEL